MRILKLGLSGDDIRKWQNFLLGQIKANVVVSGTFDIATYHATIQFQNKFKLTADGIVGQKTYIAAFKLGFSLVDEQSEHTSGFPVRPTGVEALDENQRIQLFGKFSYVSAPLPTNPEAIKFTDGWDKENIVTISVPQLAILKGKATYPVQCHKLVQGQLLSVFQAWEDADVLDRILTWNGSWVPRFKRGSRTDLSNHSWGTAFDINATWNMLGHEPAEIGQKGCVYDLVDIAVKHGWFFGGWFRNRPDGMHFEVFRLIS